jgi:hypothetical protein
MKTELIRTCHFGTLLTRFLMAADTKRGGNSATLNNSQAHGEWFTSTTLSPINQVKGCARKSPWLERIEPGA